MSLRVPASAVAELPLERKLTLLDAENDLLAATDARDAQEERALNAREAIDQGKRLRRQAEDQRSGAKQGNQSPEVAEVAVREAEAHVEFAEKDYELQREKLQVADVILLVAEARFEQARAAEVEAAALPGSRGIRAEAFQAQVDKLGKAAAERAGAAQKKQAEADEAQGKWKTARAELTRLTGGAQGSAWVQ